MQYHIPRHINIISDHDTLGGRVDGLMPSMALIKLLWEIESYGFTTGLYKMCFIEFLVSE